MGGCGDSLPLAMAKAALSSRDDPHHLASRRQDQRLRTQRMERRIINIGQGQKNRELGAQVKGQKPK